MGSKGQEVISIPVRTLSHSQLVDLYADIYQTIDGIFSGFVSSKQVVNLIAIDSTCWEIDSTSEALVDDFASRFGRFPDDA